MFEQGTDLTAEAKALLLAFNESKQACAALKAEAAPDGVFSNPWSHNLKIISPTEVHCALSLPPPTDANGGLGDKAITLDLIYNNENNTWKYKEVKIPEGIQDICGDAIEVITKEFGRDRKHAINVEDVKPLLSGVSAVMPASDECQQLISQADAQLAPMVNEFTKVSTIYSNPEFSPAKVVSLHQVSYEVVVVPPDAEEVGGDVEEAERFISQPPPPPLHLLFTYDSRTQTWDVKPSGNAVEDVEAELRNKFLYGYVNRPLEGSFEDCYGRMTQLQQNLLDCYSYHDLLISGPLDAPEVNEEVSRKIQEKICQTMVGLNTLEDKVFELLASVAQQGYLDDSCGNVIQQLLPKEVRDKIIQKSSETATYDPGVSTLACLEEYRSVFVGAPGDSREDPCHWKMPRLNLTEDLLNACVACASEEGVGEADKVKAEWLGGVINLIGKVTQSKDILSPMYARLREDSSVTGVARLCIEKAKSNWYETLKQLDQLQVKIAGEAAEQERLKLLLLVVGELDVIRLNDHNKVSSFSSDESKAMEQAESHGLLTPLTKQGEMRQFKNPGIMTFEEVTSLIAVTRQFRCFQWQPSQIDQGLENISRPRIFKLQGLKVRQGQEENKRNRKTNAMIGVAIVGMAAIAVLTVVSAGLVPLFIAGAVAVTGIIGALLSCSKPDSPAPVKQLDLTEQFQSNISLEEQLKEYTPQQLRKAFFAPVNVERPKEINRRKKVRAAVMETVGDTADGQVDLFAKMFTPIVKKDGDKTDGDYEQQSPQRDCFILGDFSVPGNPYSPPAINSSDYVVHPREIAYYYGSLTDETETDETEETEMDETEERSSVRDWNRCMFMDKMKNSPWIKRELAVFLVHAVLFDNATEEDRNLATKLMRHDSFKELRDSLFAPPLDEGSTNEQRLFIDSFLKQAPKQAHEQVPTLEIPTTDESSRKELLELMKQEYQQQGDRLKKYKENKVKWENFSLPIDEVKKRDIHVCVRDWLRREGYSNDFKVNGSIEYENNDAHCALRHIVIDPEDDLMPEKMATCDNSKIVTEKQEKQEQQMEIVFGKLKQMEDKKDDSSSKMPSGSGGKSCDKSKIVDKTEKQKKQEQQNEDFNEDFKDKTNKLFITLWCNELLSFPSRDKVLNNSEYAMLAYAFKCFHQDGMTNNLLRQCMKSFMEENLIALRVETAVINTDISFSEGILTITSSVSFFEMSSLGRATGTVENDDTYTKCKPDEAGLHPALLTANSTLRLDFSKCVNATDKPKIIQNEANASFHSEFLSLIDLLPEPPTQEKEVDLSHEQQTIAAANGVLGGPHGKLQPVVAERNDSEDDLTSGAFGPNNEAPNSTVRFSDVPASFFEKEKPVKELKPQDLTALTALTALSSN